MVYKIGDLQMLRKLTMLGSPEMKTWATGSVKSVSMLGMKAWSTGSVNLVCSYYTVFDEWQKKWVMC